MAAKNTRTRESTRRVSVKSSAGKYIKKHSYESQRSLMMWLAVRGDLNLMDMRVAIYLGLTCSFDEWTKLSGRTIAEALGSSNVNHVLVAAKRLRQLGVVRRKRSERQAFSYLLKPIPSLHGDAE